MVDPLWFLCGSPCSSWRKFLKQLNHPSISWGENLYERSLLNQGVHIAIINSFEQHNALYINEPFSSFNQRSLFFESPLISSVVVLFLRGLGIIYCTMIFKISQLVRTLIVFLIVFAIEFERRTKFDLLIISILLVDSDICCFIYPFCGVGEWPVICLSL
jgi:hypothetical protein